MAIEYQSRALKGELIARANGCVRRIDEQTYKVKSQSGNGEYDVLYNEEWYCSCPDFIHRKEKCKHIFAVEFSLKLRERVRQEVVIQPVNISDCIFCHYSVLKKYGTR